VIRVFIVAGSAVVRSGLEALFRGDSRFSVAGAGQTLSATEILREHPPDVVLMDVPENTELSAQFRFREGPAVVLLADDLSRREFRTALHYGAKAILARSSSGQEITAAIEAATVGLIVLGSDQIDTLLPSTPGRFDIDEIPAEPLTPREIEVLELLAEGAGNKQIADRLKLSEHTVKFHVSSILGKLGAASRTEAVTEAIRRGLVLV